MALTKKDIHKAPYDSPVVTGYNRLEGIPTSTDYRKALSAEVHDALWFLTRQWQMGEFDAEDAGTPIKTKVLVEQQTMTQLVADGELALDATMPLEMQVEKESRVADVTLRIELGRLFHQALVENNLQAQLPDFLAKFKLQLLETAAADSHEGRLVASVRSSRGDAQLFDTLKNRVLDGFVVWEALRDPGNAYQNWVNGTLAGGFIASGIKAGQDFLAQAGFFYGDPGQQGNPSWKPEKLGYQFDLQSDANTASATIMRAGDYRGDRLDWYDMDIVQNKGKNVVTSAYTFIPTSVTFPGMPKPRWWEMEESAINFANVNVKTTDLPTLILMDFALIYGNDWMMVPLPMQLNRLCAVKGLLVKDVFGFYTYIPPVDTGSDVSWKKWSLFSQSDGLGKIDEPLFYLAPALLKPLEQEAMEKVSFLRDEASNMAWAFENVVPGAFGKGLRGPEVADKKEETEPQPPGQDQPATYLLGTSVPFYQVPFVPVEVSFDTTHSQIRLQRARMPEGAAPAGVVLTEVASPYYIREEEVPKAGTTVVRRWQRARWINGAVAQWIGREKQTGKGEGATRLGFDVLR